MKIIALETSSQPGSVAAMVDGEICFAADLPGDQRTTVSFASVIRDAIRQQNWAPSDINLFAVCQGPGSFTGLRIGVTAAKTFAYATGSSVLAVDTLDVLNRQANSDQSHASDQPYESGKPSPSGQVWAVLDAQRHQVFAALYESDQAIRPTRIYDNEAWLNLLTEGQLVIGTGLSKIKDQVPSNVKLAPNENWVPRAKTLAKLAFERTQQEDATDFWKLSPNYFRKSAAEEKAGT